MNGFDNPVRVSNLYSEVCGLVLFGANHSLALQQAKKAAASGKEKATAPPRLGPTELNAFLEVLQKMMNMMGHCLQWTGSEKK